MKKLYPILFISICLFLFGCNASSNEKENYQTTWLEVIKKGNEYVFIDCGYKGQLLKIDENTIFERGIMEDNYLNIDYKKIEGDSIFLYTDKNEKFYYNLKWIDKEKGLGKWTIKDADVSHVMTRYYCDSTKLANYKRIKGDKEDCITNEEEDSKHERKFGTLDQNRWLGEYIFAKSISKSDSEDSVTYIFKVSQDKVSIKCYDGNKLISDEKENYLVSKDSLIIRFNKSKDYYEDEYIIVNDEDSFIISGLSIYMLNPPNTDYPIKKIK